MPGLNREGVARDEDLPVPDHQIGVLVLLDADPVTGAVDELLAVAGLGDDPAGHAVDVLGGDPGTGRGHRRLLCGSESVVAICAPPSMAHPSPRSG